MADEINTANDGAPREATRAKAVSAILRLPNFDDLHAIIEAMTRKDPSREPGFYWARLAGTPQDHWEVWQWDGNVWWGPGYPTPSTKEFFAEIGERVIRAEVVPSYEDRLADGSLGDYMADRA